MKPSKSTKPPSQEHLDLSSVVLSAILSRLDQIEEKLTPKPVYTPSTPTPDVSNQYLSNLIHDGFIDGYRKMEAMEDRLDERIKTKLSAPKDPAYDHNHHHQHHDQDETNSQLWQDNEMHQNSKQETLVRSSTHQIELSDRTRFVWFDIEQAQGLLHVRVEEYS